MTATHMVRIIQPWGGDWDGRVLPALEVLPDPRKYALFSTEELQAGEGVGYVVQAPDNRRPVQIHRHEVGEGARADYGG